MTRVQIAVVLAPLIAGAALAQTPRKCATGAEPRLSGDAFSPVECSTFTKPTVALPGDYAVPAQGKKPELKEFAGRWEGSLIHALGRYELLLTVTTKWGGKGTIVLAMKELQVRERLTDTVVLVPIKGEPGAYEAELSTDRAPGLTMKGRLRLGGPAETRQADLAFANGAGHRILLKPLGKDELELFAVSSVPGAPLQNFKTTLRRTKKEKL